MNEGNLSVNVTFPIVSITGNESYISNSGKDYAQCQRSFIPEWNSKQEFIIDSNGILYERKRVMALNYINPFKGFSFATFKFGMVFVDIELMMIKLLDVTELKNHCIETLNRKRKFLIEGDHLYAGLRKKIEGELFQENLVRYLFFINDARLYETPE